MNKWILRLMSLVVVMGLLVGCATDDANDKDTSNQDQAEQNEEMIVVTITKDKGAEEITEKEIPVKEGALLLDVMKENFEIEEENTFITSIDGIAQDVDAGIGWIYSVNGETASVGAAEYELTAGEEVNFDLQAWE